MKDQLQQRLQALQAEADAGQKMLLDLDARRSQLQTTLIRISGAIQVLEELLQSPTDSPSPRTEEGVQ